MYADTKNYSASSIPREWHGWLHYIHDGLPTKVQQYHPIYEEAAAPYKGGTADRTGSTSLNPAVYFPKV